MLTTTTLFGGFFLDFNYGTLLDLFLSHAYATTGLL